MNPPLLPEPLLWEFLERTRWRSHIHELRSLVERRYAPESHGDLGRWLQALEALPAVLPAHLQLNQPTPRMGAAEELTPDQQEALPGTLMQLHPWRKGPINLFGVTIETEWRSDWKWARLEPHITPLTGRRILDVGCGNGYYLLRMLGSGVRFALGIDPTLLSVVQYAALKKYLPESPMGILPIGIEEVPENLESFDTVFSMGVFHHRRSPFEHLAELMGLLRPGGELVLETLIIQGNTGEVLVPRDRYAQMRNVWFLPSPGTLVTWLERAGYRNVRCVDCTPTTTDEQRTTPWMTFKSLPDFLDPTDPSKTAEGYPAPIRGIFLAEKPE